MKSLTNCTLACAVAALFAPALHAAQADPAPGFPNKPIRFIVPFAPGAGTDTTARAIAQKLSEKWGHQVVADNRTGAGGTIGVDFTAKSNPDGYTICQISASNTVNAASYTNLPYDMERDLQGISQATSLFYVVYAQPSLPIKNIKDLIAYGKANPGKLNFGSSGIGTLQHFSGELFNHMAGIKMVHVPVQGHRCRDSRDAVGRGTGRLRFPHRHASPDAGRPCARTRDHGGEALAFCRSAHSGRIRRAGLRSGSVVRHHHVVEGSEEHRAEAERGDRRSREVSGCRTTPVGGRLHSGGQLTRAVQHAHPQ